ncbi:MAG: hypothetical protein HUK11_07025 [Muribaculaceae bacterium]|nr:hypothetical protein [Muribaculaceae bacterium]
MNTEKQIKTTIFRHIEEEAPHSVFFISDFAALGSTETVRKALKDASDLGMLEHIAHGIYVKPMNSRFGKVPVPLETVAIEIAARDNVQILPTGMTAANILGVSTQIPMTVSFITTGSSRIINVGNRKISFRHAAPRNFSYEGATIPLIVQAFRELTQEHVGEQEISAVAKYMGKASDKKSFSADVLKSPMWIQKILKPIIKKHCVEYDRGVIAIRNSV